MQTGFICFATLIHCLFLVTIINYFTLYINHVICRGQKRINLFSLRCTWNCSWSFCWIILQWLHVRHKAQRHDWSLRKTQITAHCRNRSAHDMEHFVFWYSDYRTKAVNVPRYVVTFQKLEWPQLNGTCESFFNTAARQFLCRFGCSACFWSPYLYWHPQDSMVFSQS